MSSAPTVKRPSRSTVLRDMNRDLLLGMLMPGRDRFEVRGWVRWLLGDPQGHVPEDDVDRRRFEQLRGLDDDALDELRVVALTTLDAARDTHGSPAYERGVMAHDTLMSVLLEDTGNVESLRLSAFQGDADKLLDMMHIDQVDLDDDEFHAGFQWANRQLADAVATHLN